jgi:hypothetical protein
MNTAHQFAIGLAVLSLLACDTQNTGGSSQALTTSYPLPDVIGPEDVKDGTFTVCKEVVEGEDDGQLFTFNTTYVLNDEADQPTVVNPTVDLPDGQCEDVYVSSWGPDAVTITEIVPEGWVSPPGLEVWTKDDQGNVWLDPHDPATSLKGAIEDGKVGCLVIFQNSKIPDEGGQGCTPGYWKNNWTKKGGTAFGPTGVDGDATTLGDVGFAGFSVLDGDATSFVDALAAQGGGESAVMRHGAAAYLNASHPDIDYGKSAADVVAAVNAALAAGDADGIEALKDELDGLNNEGCSLDQQGRVKSSDED